MATGPVVHDGPDGMPVRYSGWNDWRTRRATPLPAIPYAPLATDWCFTCSRRGYVLFAAHKPNGEFVAWIKETCPSCEGKGHA